ncbi:YegS/Rv2252/BmrU family lipid kinase [Halomonas sp. M5N1S17]|uniref:diacylglycerol/lipid kinase family protein n=1 Tax=Halomonas alkalisoli TaxID=2907158 RepID=UPI001F26BD7D|nr:YegS/Rv2252/BmrU family lipid kinase [Halomonas alkalisoli]MCE9663303.1 YegS/Rv2252/BmrU family lipid kinase [Halomonas alkalisoli]
MRDWLIVNGKAGDGKRGESFWKAHLNAAGISDVTTRDLTQSTWDSDICEGDRVLVAGGDGSVNRVASVCVERKATLAVLPSGTANDFSRNLGLPEDPAELCRLIASGQTTDVDVAWVNDNLFLNVAHIGLGTLPAREASQGQKRRWGRFSYLFTLAQQAGLQKGIHARIECNEQVTEGRWLTIAIASGAYFGGGHNIAEARIDDGHLDIVAVRQRFWLTLLIAYLRTRLLRRAPRRHDTVVHFKAPQCRIQLRHEHTLTADGEDMGRMADVFAFTRHGVLKVLCEQLTPPQPLMLREQRFTPSDTHPMAWSSSGPF